MRSSNASPLPDDILGQIMTFCPNFGTLQALILSITYKVARNVVGPALPQALRVIRYPYNGYSPKNDPSVMATACPEDSNITILTATEKTKLEENSLVVGKLEDIYSLLNKDRTSQKSLLTAQESLRFHRAMYRVMLFTNIFPGSRYLVEEFEDLEHDDPFFQKIYAQRTAILNEYSTVELRELSSASSFLLDIFDDAARTRNHALLSTGPSGALRTWEARTYDGLEDELDFNVLDDSDRVPLYDGYISLPLKNIWIKRNLRLPKEDDEDEEEEEEEDEEPSPKWILDSVNGADDTCSKCDGRGGLDLYTEANWFRFFGRNTMADHLKERLTHNTTLTQPLKDYTGHFAATPQLIGPFISNLFTQRTDKFNGWESTDSYCYYCLRKFVEEHLWRWLLAERVKNGWTPPENCWYGWDCRTQTRNSEHASTKNASRLHLCDPIKGDKAVAGPNAVTEGDGGDVPFSSS
ncbi:hypothetical protein MSAN_00850700 [Mycena sanguinolenta]|uniref:Uncharacterized protein n=1 Tax=Mycena sanguinolenta TaxID=230812 RepID=A0A8H6YZ62_9AGAR|nr:hypothetical protein MSAN_00850700 [Mycena sanguinolenta]